VIFSNTAGEQVDKIIFPKQYTNISYGRLEDGAQTWAYLVSPSPGSTNVNETATTLELDKQAIHQQYCETQISYHVNELHELILHAHEDCRHFG
jgi:hypothetical protein